MTDLAPLVPLAEALVRSCIERKLRVATAESCTGGLVAVAITEIPGSSAILDRGFVTYADEAKTEMLAVAATLIAAHGAVSEPVVRAMAEGALAYSRADIAVAITGIAGPSGGSPDKPVGLVHFAVVRRGGRTRHIAHRFPDRGRSAIRLAAATEALRLLQALVDAGPLAPTP